uniref:Nuclear pore complex protein Nup205 n=1 Tax=Schistocephalus solidus TaxID=70667 RepID=A0A0X3Q2Y9_SCHSO
MWAIYKTIGNLVIDIFCNGQDEKIIQLESFLEQHKDAFLNPAKNPPPSMADRQLVKKADSEAISLPGMSQKILLTRDIIEEACTISDLFDFNELAAVELLLSAEGQLPSYPNLTRGLVAIILYYDAQRAIAESLRTIFQSRNGRIWSVRLSKEAATLVESFTSDLLASGLVSNILKFLSSFDISTELSRLEGVNAIGNPKHRRDLLRLLAGIRNCLAECILLLAAQTPLDFASTKLILNHLTSVLTNLCAVSNPENRHATQVFQLRSSPPLDHASVHLVFALLYCFEPFGDPGVEIDQLSDATEEDLKHPLFVDARYVAMITRLLTASDSSSGDLQATEGIFGLLQLSWAVCLRRVSHLRMELRRHRQSDEPAVSLASTNQFVSDSEIVDDDVLLNTALESDAIEFLSYKVVCNPDFHREKLWIRRVHGLITDTLVHFPQNVRGIRLRDEAIARRTGRDPSAMGTGFAALLNLLSQMYDVLGSPLHARLSLEYWWSAGETTNRPASPGSSFLLAHENLLRVKTFRADDGESSRQAMLFRFVYSASEFASSPSLFVPYVKMLRSLVGCQSSANLCFNLLKTTVTTGGRLANLLTWDHFIQSLQQYLEHFKLVPHTTASSGGLRETASLGLRGAALPLHLQHPHLYQTALCDFPGTQGFGTGTGFFRGQPTPQIPQQQQQQQPPAEIQPEEVEALRAVVALITRIALIDPIARVAFATNQQWKLVPVVIGLVTCPLPLAMKGDLFTLLSALCQYPSITSDIWHTLCDAKLFAFLDASKQVQKQCAGFHTELDIVEPRAEEYPVTQAFLTFLSTIAPIVTELSSSQSTYNASETFTKLTLFVTETVFLKHTMRAYRKPSERWDVAGACIIFFEGLVQAFLHRMKSIAVFVSSSSGSTCVESDLENFDWATVFKVQHHQIPSGFPLRLESDATAATSRLNLPYGWPLTDPGYQMAIQLLTNSSFFSVLTGLLEVGVHRLLEYPSSSPCAMVRTTASILRLFENVLQHERMLINLVRCVVISVPQIRLGLPNSLGSGIGGGVRDVILPMLLSRNLVTTVNAHTGRADYLLNIVRYCCLLEDFPDHCKSALSILSSVVRSFEPHEAVLAVFTSEKRSEQELLHALVSCLTLAGLYSPSVAEVGNDNLLYAEADSDCGQVFTDAWLWPADLNEDLTSIGLMSGCAPHPALRTARLCAAVPTLPVDWDFSQSNWELMASLPKSQVIAAETPSSVSTDGGRIWFPRLLSLSGATSIKTVLLHLILHNLAHHSGPSLALWLLGFRCKDARSIPLTTLQDAGVGGFPRTCLHALLEIIELAVQTSRTQVLLPHCVALQWDAAVAWQILYRLAASPVTSVPTMRYLRGNHDLVQRHITAGLTSVTLLHCSASTETTVTDGENQSDTARALRALTLNQMSWLLKMVAIEFRSSASQRSYLTRLLRILFSAPDHPSLFDAPSGPNCRQTCLLVDILSSMKLAEEMRSPEWMPNFSDESKLLERLIVACEENCILVSAEDRSNLWSSIINTATLHSRLRFLLPLLQTGFSEFRSAPADLSESLITDVVAFAHRRNMYRLCLSAGKQACLEGWRQVAELGLHRFKVLNKLNLMTSPPVTDFRTSSSLSEIPEVTVSTPPRDHVFTIAMSLLSSVLQEVAASLHSPTVLKVLASGSCLSLSAFCQSALTPSIGRVSSLPHYALIDLQSVLSAVGLLSEAILVIKPAFQRVRANYYAALCFLLDICQRHDAQLAISTDRTRSFGFQAVSILVGDAYEKFAGNVVPRHSQNSFLSMLVNDISAGNHPVIPIAALSLLNILLKFDRSSGRALDILTRDGFLQSLVDSIRDDLTPLQQYFLRDDPAPYGGPLGEDVRSLQEATAAFYVYQAKMAFLSRLISIPQGAKLLTQSSLLSAFSKIELFSASSLANSLSAALSEEVVCTRRQSSNSVVTWLDSYELTRFLFSLMATEGVQTVPSDDSTRTGVSLSAAVDYASLADSIPTSDLLSGSGVLDTGETRDMTWQGIIMPTLCFIKALLFAVGPHHSACIQETLRFVSAHSDALLTTSASCRASVLISTAALPEASDTDTGTLFQPICDWLKGEECIVSLLVVLLRSRPPPNLSEPDVLSRDLLCTKALRHVFAILPNLLQTLQSNEQRTFCNAPSSNIRSLFERCFLATREIQLLNLLVSAWVAAISTEENFVQLQVTFSKNMTTSVIPASLSETAGGDTVCPAGASPNFNFLLQLVTWSVARLHQLETVITSIGRLLSPSVDSEDSKSAKAETSIDRLLHFLVLLPVSPTSDDEDLSVDSLQQIVTSLFISRPLVPGNLLQNKYVTSGTF